MEECRRRDTVTLWLVAAHPITSSKMLLVSSRLQELHEIQYIAGDSRPEYVFVCRDVLVCAVLRCVDN